MRHQKKAVATSIAVLLLGLGYFVVLPRGAVRAAEEKLFQRGFETTIDHARIGWMSISFYGAELGLEGVSSVKSTLREIKVGVSMSLQPTSVEIVGGNVAITDAKRAESEIAGWRERHRSNKGESPAASGPSLTVRELDIRILSPDVTVRGVEASRDGSLWTIAGEEAFLTDPRATIRSLHPHLELLDKKMRSFSSEMVDLTVGPVAKPEIAGAASVTAASLPSAVKLGAPASSQSAVLPSQAPTALPSQAPLALPSQAGAHDPMLAAGETGASFASLIPKTRTIRKKIDETLEQLNLFVAPEASLTVQKFALHFPGQFDLGPGIFSLQRKSDDPRPYAVTYSTGKSETSPPLEAVIEAGVGTDTKFLVSGGPIPLSMLGVKNRQDAEGGSWFQEVEKGRVSAKGSVVLSGEGDALTFDQTLSVSNIHVAHEKLSKDPIRDLGFEAVLRGNVQREETIRIDHALFRLGALSLEGRGTLSANREGTEGSGLLSMKRGSCDALFRSLPEGIVPDLAGVRLAGEFGLQGELAFNSRALDKLKLDIRLNDDCTFSDMPAIMQKSRFTGPFLHRVYSPKGEWMEEEMGPGSRNWTPLEEISPFMRVAVLTTEDGAFYHHRGFSIPAIRNSLVDNLKAGKFVRGASTITMQLAKNLFLYRTKTLSRKLQELILTAYLEQAFSKDEMMELYLNVVEFGPSTYGITAAAEHYFGRSPNELTLAECFFLASMLPKPNGAHWVYEKGLPEYWLKNLRSLMRIAEKRGTITSAELAEGEKQTVVFQPENAPRPSPRKPQQGSRFSAPDDTSDWTPSL